MRSVGMRPLVVHGGGPQIGELMARLGKVPEFVDGLRVTDAETLDIARMVLVGKVNRDIVSAINVHAPLAVGVSGEDAGLISAQARDPQLGFVGDVAAVNPDLVNRLLAEDLIPVVATIGSDATGQAYNINADTAAGAIAEAVGAAKLVYLTDVDGIRRDRHDPGTRISAATADDLEAMLADGTIEGGMIPKVRSCLRAVSSGVRHAHILDGRQAHALLLEIFTREGVGTMVIGPEKGSLMTADNHLMATYAPPPVTFVRGAGQPAVGRRRSRVPRLPLRAGGHLARPRPPGGGRRHLRPGPDPAARVQPLRHRAPARGGGHPRPAARRRDRAGSSSATAAPRPTSAPSSWPARWGGRGQLRVVSAYGSFHGRTLATLHATGQPAKHEPFQPLPEGFRHVAWRDLDALAAAIDPSVAAVLLEPVQGEGGVNPGRRRVLPGGPTALRRAGRPADRRRGADRPGPHGRVVRVPALRHPARTW